MLYIDLTCKYNRVLTGIGFLSIAEVAHGTLQFFRVAQKVPAKVLRGYMLKRMKSLTTQVLLQRTC